MNPIVEQQFEALKVACKGLLSGASHSPLPNGAHLVTIQDFKLPLGWNRPNATILFVIPPGYPAAQPDCFWVEPGEFRLQNESTPQASNDSNPIPGETAQRHTTWFSWHLQGWNPNKDSLITYFKVIMQRLDPPR